MNREIKFRAFDGKYWYYFNIPSLQFSPTLIRLFGDDNTRYCQFTGLRDKNERDIYEGDIYTTDNRISTNIAVVNWNSKKARYQQNLSYKDTEVEVIGNIYESPELIKTT